MVAPTTLDIEERVLTSPALPSLPHVAFQIIQLVRDPNTSVKAIADCLSADPALVQKILRTVNSSLYGLRNKVSTVTQAATLLGANALRGLVLGFNLPRTGPEGDGFSMVTFWRYSLTSAVAARLLAQRAGYADAEEAFVAGLLEDIGVLALHQALSGEYLKVLAARRERLKSSTICSEPGAAATILCQIERETLGTDHARVGGRLLNHWGLPDILAIPVRFHHAPADLDDPSPRIVDLTRILNLAALVGQTFNLAGKQSCMNALDWLGKAYFGLGRQDVERTLEQIAESVQQAAKLFDIDIGQPPGYEQILQEANEELAHLTLVAERAAQQEARTKVEVERRANQLESLNLELADRANRDAMTGIFNRGFFDHFLAEQFARGLAAGRPMGLILMDIHRFKRINDTFGHPQGDAVIVELARRLRTSTRDCDLVARYGGDEFVVVMPEADLEALKMVAARLRRSVWDRPFPALTGGVLEVSIGMGAVWVSDYARLKGPAQVLETADRVLYATKHTRDRTIYLVRV